MCQKRNAFLGVVCTTKATVEAKLDGQLWVLLAQDVFELVGSADGEQQGPGQQSVGVELTHLGTHRRTGTIRPGVGPDEQVLEALHGRVHVLKQQNSQV